MVSSDLTHGRVADFVEHTNESYEYGSDKKVKFVGNR
jgi:hypothetical protein